MLEKIKDSEINELNVKSTQGSRLTGTVAENKNVFDKFPELIAQKINAIIDSLSGSGGVSGADNISVGTIEGITGTTVQAVLEAFKRLLDDTYNKSDVDMKLVEKASQDVVDKSIRTVELDSATGILTFIRQDGSSYTIDTMLEKIVTNFDYDPLTQSLVFTASDGTSHIVSIAEFVTNNEFAGSDQITFSVAGGIVTANIKNGCITDAMLDSTIKTSLEGFRDAAKKSADNAAASETNAATNASGARKSAGEAAKSADAAKLSEQVASGYIDDVKSNAELAKSYAVGGTETRPGENTDNAKYYKDLADSARSSTEVCLATVENNTKLATAAAGRAAESVKDIDDKISAAKASATSAQEHAAGAHSSADTAVESASAAQLAETGATTAAFDAEASSKEAKSYAVGGTNSRTNEDADNAKYYADDAKKSAETAQSYVGQVEASASNAAESAQLASQKALDASASASNAAISEANAVKGAASVTKKAAEAATSAETASQKAVDAKASADSITDGAEVATRKAAEASASAEAATVAQKAAEQAAKEAQGVVEGDFATNAALEGHAKNTTVHITADERKAWNGKAETSHTHDNYVEKAAGKVLSSNDYTDADKAKVGRALTKHQDISEYATKNYVDANGGKIDVIKVNGAVQPITDKGVDLLVPTKNSQLENDSGFLTQHQDVSGKAEKTYVDQQDTAKLAEAKGYAEKLVSDLVNGAPEALDTLKELADAVTNNTELMSVLNEAIGNKVSKENGKGLSSNDYTANEKNKLAGIADNANKYIHPAYTAKPDGLYKMTVDATGHISTATPITKADITGLGIPAQDTVYAHPASHPAAMISEDAAHRFVTDAEKAAWDNKVDAAYVETNGGKIDVIKVNGATQPITNKNVNLSVPTKVSELENDSNFATKEYVDGLMLVDENTEV